MKKERKELNTLEWTIYNIIRKRSESGLWTTQYELNELLRKEGFEISLREQRKHLTFIRTNDIIQKIILSNTVYGYKLMSDEEEKVYLEKQFISILKKLKRYYKDRDRLELNGQLRLTFGTHERECIESLIKLVD